MSARQHDQDHFFKYASFSTAMRVIVSKSFRWSSPTKFNDPFDHQVGFAHDIDVNQFAARFAKSRERVIYTDTIPRGYPLAVTSALHLRQYRDQLPHAELLEEISAGALEVAGNLELSIAKLTADSHRLLCHSRIFCVSERHDNVVMWSHYADGHRGVVFKLRCVDDIDNCLLAARKVTYLKSFIPFPPMYAEHLAGEEPIDFEELVWQMAFAKHEHWSYENEWRVHRSLIHEPEGDGYSVYEENPRVFGDVYLGCKMEEPEVKIIVGLARQHLPGSKIYQAQMSRTAFALEFAEVEVKNQ